MFGVIRSSFLLLLLDACFVCLAIVDVIAFDNCGNVMLFSGISVVVAAVP